MNSRGDNLFLAPRARELIVQLGLEAHPEGGYFRRIHASEVEVVPGDERGTRSALSIIYYLLVEGTYSRWHRVDSDEVWHYVEGACLELFLASPQGGKIDSCTLGPIDAASTSLHVIPARWWQAAQPVGPYTLFSCTVGPGFAYEDFVLLSDLPEGQRPHFLDSKLLERFF